jgi:hypothetical protein
MPYCFNIEQYCTVYTVGIQYHLVSYKRFEANLRNMSISVSAVTFNLTAVNHADKTYCLLIWSFMCFFADKLINYSKSEKKQSRVGAHSALPDYVLLVLKNGSS